MTGARHVKIRGRRRHTAVAEAGTRRERAGAAAISTYPFCQRMTRLRRFLAALRWLRWRMLAEPFRGHERASSPARAYAHRQRPAPSPQRLMILNMMLNSMRPII